MPQQSASTPVDSTGLLAFSTGPSVFGLVARNASLQGMESGFSPQYGARELTVKYAGAAPTPAVCEAQPVTVPTFSGVDDLLDSQLALEGLFEHDALLLIPDINDDISSQSAAIETAAANVTTTAPTVVPVTVTGFPKNPSREDVADEGSRDAEIPDALATPVHRRILRAPVVYLALVPIVISITGYIAVTTSLDRASSYRPSPVPAISSATTLPKPEVIAPQPHVATTVRTTPPVANPVIVPTRPPAMTVLPLPRQIESPPVVFEQTRPREQEPKVVVKEPVSTGKVVLLDSDEQIKQKDDIPSPGKFVLLNDTRKAPAPKLKLMAEQ